MNKAGCDVDKIIELRHHLHMYPEGGFKEFKTQQKMIDNLVSYGIEDKNIKKCAGTGLVVDVWGKAAPDARSEPDFKLEEG